MTEISRLWLFLSKWLSCTVGGRRLRAIPSGCRCQTMSALSHSACKSLAAAVSSKSKMRDLLLPEHVQSQPCVLQGYLHAQLCMSLAGMAKALAFVSALT